MTFDELTLEEVVRRLVETSKDLKQTFEDVFTGLLLFGSYPRGEASKESDVDVLVVLRGLGDLRVRGEIYSILARHVEKPLTLILADLADLIKEDLEITPLLLNSLYDGIVICDEGGVLQRLKTKVDMLVKKSNLVRYRTPDGKYGWKRVDDKPIEAVEV
jgi:predicted nucleotidyltransferase